MTLLMLVILNMAECYGYITVRVFPSQGNDCENMLFS